MDIDMLEHDLVTEAREAQRLAEKDTAILRARLTLREARIRELEHDPVTRLPTRAQCVKRADRSWERASRTGLPIGVSLVDVDRFKLINDEGGHAEGDRVLELFACILRGAVREADFVGRWGGDEFIIICEAATPSNMLRGAQRILGDIRNFTPVTCSIGMAIENEHDLNTMDVLTRADANLLEVKRRGRDDLKL
jgi:diguanylate cyclase (GGDEF)-like protein